jgi:nicotinamidase-related amidase
MRKWESIFSDADRAVAEKAGFGEKQLFGNKPALLIVDVNRGFVGSKPQPILESIEEYGTSCGEAGWVALQNIQRLLQACRAKKIPVIFTTNDIVSIQFSWGPTKMAGPSQKVDLKSQEIAEAIKPLPSELIIKKTKASAFFGTPLVSILHNLKVDCLVITGCTTSGCVRASVVDAFSYKFPCFVVEECTFDRFELSHLVNLWDMNVKYADVINLSEALDYLASMP